MSIPPNNVPGRSMALTGRDITGSINAISQQNDIEQAYQAAQAAAASSGSVSSQVPLLGLANGANLRFALPRHAPNGFSLYADGKQLTSSQYSVSGLYVTVKAAPSTSMAATIF
jgi:hypothetical protein